MTDTIDAVLTRIERQRQDGEGLEVPADCSPLEFLQAVYRCAAQPMARRLKAAVEAAAYAHPKLSATAIVGQDLATLLDSRLARIAEQPKLINAAPQNPPVRVPPAPHDRRFRR